MHHNSHCGIHRRDFLHTMSGVVTGGLVAAFARGADLPTNVNPRAISGDVVEPDWKQHITITVGPSNADFIGSTDRAIQAAVNHVSQLRGGTVRLLPGVYRQRNSIFLRSKTRLTGSGPETILMKEPSFETSLSVDGDHWDQEITVTDPSGLQVGDGVRLVSQDPFGKGTNIIQRTVIASSGNRFKLDHRLAERFHLAGTPKIATNFALLQCTDVNDVIIENLTVDGNRANNVGLDRGRFDDGAIRFDESNRVTARNLTVREYHCDGIVWGISHDVLIAQCRMHHGTRFGVHAGSGSQRSIVRQNQMDHNEQGIYFCWGAQHGLYEKNVIEDCVDGITLGHRDSDNLIRDNDIRRSGKTGIRFRGGNLAFAPHRNRFEGNRIVDTGGTNGIAIHLMGECEGVALIRNQLRETRGPQSRIGVLIAAETRNVHCEKNVIEGFAIDISDLRKA